MGKKGRFSNPGGKGGGQNPGGKGGKGAGVQGGGGKHRAGKRQRTEPPTLPLEPTDDADTDEPSTAGGGGKGAGRVRKRGLQTQGVRYWDSMAKRYDREIYDSFNEGGTHHAIP